jgi:hypothetical protein
VAVFERRPFVKRETPQPGNRDKPALTEHNVNRLAEAILSQEGMGEHKRRLKEDWKAFVRSAFRLSRTQERNLQNIPVSEVRMVQGALRAAADYGGGIELSLGSEFTGEPGALWITAPEGNDEQGLTVGGSIKCTFDADCGNWQCGVEPGV